MVCETLGIHIQRFVNSKSNPNTRDWYDKNLKQLVAFFGEGRSLDSIGRVDADKYWQFLLNRKDAWETHPLKPTRKRALSRTTLHNYLRSVRTFWNAMVRQRLMEYNPFDHLSCSPDKQVAEMKAITPEDLRALRETAQSSGKRDYAIITVLATSGIRAGELVSMQVQHLNLKTGKALVYGKRGWRKVFLGKESVDAIEAYMAERQTDKGDDLWLNVYGQPLTTDGVRQLVDRLAEQANVTGRHNLHAFRHRFAQSWLDKGMNAEIVSKALGHADVTVTLLVYGNQDERRVAKAMRQMEMTPFEDPEDLDEL